MKRWRRKNVLSTSILKMLSSRLTKNRTRFELKHKQFWSQQLKFIQQTSEQLCHSQDITPPSSKYDTISLVGNIQMISYCKLTMTQMSCQLSHFNISHWILWHLCQSGVTVTANTRNNHNTRAPGHSSTNCDNLINTLTTDWRKCKSGLEALHKYMIQL